MKNKTITIVCTVLIICAIICFGYIAINSKVKESKKAEEKPEENLPVNEEVIEREERGQNINVNSRIGLQLKELVKYSEIYSSDITNELDRNGISDKVKLLSTLDKIYRKDEYKQYLQYSEEYNNSYILPENMNTVISQTFTDSSITENQVDDILSFDENTNSYVIIPRGFATGSIGYVLEIPYKVTEYSDRVEMLAYRVYVTKNIAMESIESSITLNLYYDKAKSSLAFNESQDVDFIETDEVEYVKAKIDEGTINSNLLETVKYTFTQVDSQYRISNFEKQK